MPPLAPADHMFTKVHSKLTCTELVQLAAALGLETEERANVQQLKAITGQKLKSKLSRYIKHLSFEQLFSKRDHQNYNWEQLIKDNYDEWEGFREPRPDDSASHLSGSNHPTRQNREGRPAQSGPICNRNQKRFRVAKKSMRDLIVQDLERRAKEKALDNKPESSGKLICSIFKS
jgi:hypothetical protein